MKGRMISPGKTKGIAIVSKEPIGFYGGIDIKTGIVIEKDHQRLTQSQIKKTDIFIGTVYLVKFHIPDISLSAILNADQSLNIPDFQASQRTFQTLSFIKKLVPIVIMVSSTNFPSTY